MINTSHFFKQIYDKAGENAIMITDTEGIIKQVNEAFTTAYGYTTDDLQAKHFRILYIEKDQVLLKPEIELNKTQREGRSSDENYLVHKDGSPLWVTGESILVTAENASCIVKIIHNIHAQKQLERFLLASNDLLDSLFYSVQSGLLLLDGRLRTVKSNTAFDKMFHLSSPVEEGIKIQDIQNPFWTDEELKINIKDLLVKGAKLDKHFIDDNKSASSRKLHIKAKAIYSEGTEEKRILLIIREV